MQSHAIACLSYFVPMMAVDMSELMLINTFPMVGRTLLIDYMSTQIHRARDILLTGKIRVTAPSLHPGPGCQHLS
jgi:hypothetical protein